MPASYLPARVSVLDQATRPFLFPRLLLQSQLSVMALTELQKQLPPMARLSLQSPRATAEVMDLLQSLVSDWARLPERPLELFLPEAHPPDPAKESASEDSQELASVSLLAALSKEPQVLPALRQAPEVLVQQPAMVLALSAMEQPVLMLQGSRTAFRLELFPQVYRFVA